ncbi:CAAX protease self-immunity [Duganella sacchari]|uniref:CAAX protease self-immunity n=1 Tax=Duganella sacchari TaxID=551987 RepID=A0A1M7NT14_9BURK|nr:CPBP family intramembrane glutamic endopeptidase [Duganella sacchari]SHN07091.1 CAAX protease self-immunity [Duganella sacchari]
MIDLVLAFYLVFILPVRHLWRSVRPSTAPKRPLAQRYVATIRDVCLLLVAMLACCWWNGYSAVDLGLTLPASGVPLWCLGAAVIGMAILLASTYRSTSKMTDAKRVEMLDRMRDSGMPTTSEELRLCVLLAFALGGGWELLYRGFLLLALKPYIGVWGAVALSGLAYGAAHGYKNPKQFALSIVMALAFAVAYALSGSLWWLMVIHIVLPLNGALTSWQLHARRPALQLD